MTASRVVCFNELISLYLNVFRYFWPYFDFASIDLCVRGNGAILNWNFGFEQKKKYNSDAWILNFSFFADNSHKESVRMLISFVCVNVEN